MMDNTKNKNGRELFVKAIDNAIDMNIQEELKYSAISGKCSKNHRRVVKNILYGNGEKTLPERKPLSRRAVAAILIAAILLLTGCAAVVIYHNEIAGFFETVFDDHTVVTPDDEGDYPTTIEKIYEFTYVPEGYEFVDEIKSIIMVAYTYENSLKGKLQMKQVTIDKVDVRVDNDKSYSIALAIDDVNVYYQVNDEWHKYLFEYDGYSISLDSTVELDEIELTNIYNGIQIKK